MRAIVAGASALVVLAGCELPVEPTRSAPAEPPAFYSHEPAPPTAVSPPENLALNPARTGFPHPLESDAGWGGGADTWDILDGTRNYAEWYNGLAFTGGAPGFVAPCGWRQATVTFAGPTAFNRVAVWHHGRDHAPVTYALDYHDGSSWIEIFSTVTGNDFLVFPVTISEWWEGWSTPTENVFPTVTGTKVRLRINNCDITHGWIYSFEVYHDVAPAPAETSPPENLALNPARTGFPHPLESDAGWGGGADVWDLVDGTRNYAAWFNGLAFTGGAPGFVAPCGWRQATVTFAGPTAFNRVLVWHHGRDHTPITYSLDFYDGAGWTEILATTSGRDFLLFPDGPDWWQGWSTPTENAFPTVTGTKVRLRVNNCDITHGWIYSFEVYLDEVPNGPPTADPGGPYLGAEGAAVALAMGGGDADGDPLTFTWDLGDGTRGSGPTPPTSHTWADDGFYLVTLTVDDGRGGTDTKETSVEVANVAPSITSLTGPADPIPLVSGAATAAVELSFADPAGIHDSYSAIIDCGDGSSHSPSSILSPHAGSCTYHEAGVYALAAIVSDEDGGTSEQALFRYVVVYDPSGGFVTGGGWFGSPAGACLWSGCAPDGSTTGKATFGFVSKYLKGANVPTGNTEFQFRAGGLDFKSTLYQWLVVAGARAQFKGEGTINGRGAYGFLLTAVDGQAAGGGSTDRFRIKIWERESGAVVYDNQVGAGDDADPATALGGGSITVHR